MIVAITILHVIVSIGLILVVLLQTGKGAEVGAVFGGSSATIFGSSGAGNFLTRLTTGMAIVFMLTSLTLGYFAGKKPSSTIFDRQAPVEAPRPSTQPASPGQQSGAPTNNAQQPTTPRAEEKPPTTKSPAQ
ncbi:MAG TPA: preprotein translocase subunit SecG [Terriglobales bacterium]|nr:preprotein translocase subunit SecG [Terriglobales bacterium]